MGFLTEFDAAPDPAKILVLTKWIAADPLGMYAELRAARPILQVPSPTAGVPPTTVLSLYDDVREALTRNAIFQVIPYARAIDPSVGPYMLARDDTTINQRDKSIMLAVLRREDLPQVRSLVRGHAEASIAELGAAGTDRNRVGAGPARAGSALRQLFRLPGTGRGNHVQMVARHAIRHVPQPAAESAGPRRLRAGGAGNAQLSGGFHSGPARGLGAR
ncbi:MAG: hypothetical protein WDN69_35630 [Aliidongia sp.]